MTQVHTFEEWDALCEYEQGGIPHAFLEKFGSLGDMDYTAIANEYADYEVRLSNKPTQTIDDLIHHPYEGTEFAECFGTYASDDEFVERGDELDAYMVADQINDLFDVED